MRCKTEERRQRILQEATLAFEAVGFEHTSMSEIAQRVGGSKATLYNYFPSKAELFVSVMEDASRSSFEEAFGLLQSGTDIRRTLSAFAFHYLKTVLSPKIIALKRMAQNEGSRSEVGRLLHEHGPKKGWAMFTSFLDQAVAAGLLPATSTTVASMHFKALVEAEYVDVCMLGVRDAVPDSELQASVDRAMVAWFKAYGT